MQRFLLSLNLILTVLAFSGCGDGCARSKDGFLQDFYAFIDQVKQHPPTDGSAWEKKDDKFRLFIRQCYPKFKEEMNLGEKIQFWWSGLGYFYVRYGKNILDMVAGDELLREVKTNLEALNQNFENTLQTVKDTWGTVSESAQQLWQGIKGLFQ